MSMSQNPNRTPSEHPKPQRLKWVVNSPIPTWDPIGFDSGSYGYVSFVVKLGSLFFLWEAKRNPRFLGLKIGKKASHPYLEHHTVPNLL